MTFKTLISILILYLCVTGCSNIAIPEVRKVKNAKLTGLNARTVDFDLDIELFNPNNEALEVKSINLNAIMEGLTLDAIKQQYDNKMLGKSTYLLPVNVQLSLKELAKKDGMDIMSKALKIYNSKEINLTFVGDLTVSDGVGDTSIPIDHTQIVSFTNNMK